MLRSVWKQFFFLRINSFRNFQQGPKVEKLFTAKGTNQFYEDVRVETQEWHSAAKTHWQELCDRHHSLLDANFSTELGNDTYSRLWELTQVEFLAQHQQHGITLESMSGKNSSKPDFCFALQGNKFYLEATCPNIGCAEALHDQRLNIAKAVPIIENMERFCSAIQMKGDKKYHSGYKNYIGDSNGLILTISLAKIPFQNRTGNYENELRCIFGMSALTFPIIQDSEGAQKMGNPYHTPQQCFDKKTKEDHSKKSPIKMDYFTTPEYAYISAILISYSDCVFFPGIDQYLPFINWRYCQNDYVLVHNPFAKIKLPVGFFNVLREVTATVVDGGMEIKTIDKTVTNSQVKTEEIF